MKRVWQKQVKIPPRVEARQHYMVGSSNLVFPVAGYAEDTRIRLVSQRSLWNSTSMASQSPGVVAKVFWAEKIVLVLRGPNTEMRFPMTLLCQEQCAPAASVLKDRGKTFAFRFLCHVACILTWLRYQGYTLFDLGETNMGMTLDSVASPQPAVRFFDVLSWRKEQRTDGKWTGFHKLAAKVAQHIRDG